MQSSKFKEYIKFTLTRLQLEEVVPVFGGALAQVRVRSGTEPSRIIGAEDRGRGMRRGRIEAHKHPTCREPRYIPSSVTIMKALAFLRKRSSPVSCRRPVEARTTVSFRRQKRSRQPGAYSWLHKDVKHKLLGADFEASIQPTGYSPNTARVAFEHFLSSTAACRWHYLSTHRLISRVSCGLRRPIHVRHSPT